MTALEIAKEISKKPDADYSEQLHDLNLHSIFNPIYKLKHTTLTCNKVVAFVIFAYSKSSTWLDIKKDRIENKKAILKSLHADINSDLFKEILINQNDEVNYVITEYLIQQTDWRWQTILTQYDYHANMIRFVNQRTESQKSIDQVNKEGEKQTIYEDIDIDKVTKVNKQKGELLQQALEARKEADKLLLEIQKEFVALDTSVKEDFKFSITEEVDMSKWRNFIRYDVLPLKSSKKSG